MCGFTGFWGPPGREAELRERAAAMSDTLAHRGPDDSGAWVDAELGLVLAHRRLSIIDLSAEGHQPMASRNGRYLLVYNGEIYNYRALRAELESRGHGDWRGHSDTEVLLAAITEWGLAATLPRLNGMFALALWDRHERRLYLARDPLGEKPLYYGWSGGALFFGSELKSFRAHPRFRAEIDPEALRLYMRYGYVPSPLSIYQGIRKLPPGTWAGFRSPADSGRAPEAYWSVRDVAERGAASRFTGSEEELTSRLDELLRDAVRLRMEAADVPLGAFLSGGVDSSTVVALMQAQSARPVQTFSIGFTEAGYNEAEHAKSVAAHLGTDHTELYVTPEQALGVVPLLPAMYDEPFADSSQIPTFLVAQLARERVTVSLSGDGGDELFGGYNRHAWGDAIWERARAVPPGLRRAAARGITGISPARWDRIFQAVQPVLPRSLVHRQIGDKLHKAAAALAATDERDLYARLLSQWGAEVVLGEGGAAPSRLDARWARLGLAEQMMYLDTVQYLPDDILVKVDRATMAVSLEGRIPLLDPRVVEFAWRLPLSLKVRNGQGKYLLRQVLYRYVPRELIERPKAGFAVPIDRWLRGPLREWAEELLDERRMRGEELLAAGLVRKRWEEHLSGSRNWQHHLWTVLMFRAWKESGVAAAGAVEVPALA